MLVILFDCVFFNILTLVISRWSVHMPVHEQAQSNRACNICNFVVLGFLYGFFVPVFCFPQYFTSNVQFLRKLTELDFGI